MLSRPVTRTVTQQGPDQPRLAIGRETRRDSYDVLSLARRTESAAAGSDFKRLGRLASGATGYTRPVDIADAWFAYGWRSRPDRPGGRCRASFASRYVASVASLRRTPRERTLPAAAGCRGPIVPPLDSFASRETPK